ncbi:LysR family transcriptional regulator [Actinomadura verrucosospora]|uniref:LysR family transcriptional regulator n=1 Tax=Actinomadura verrucosospora TaxID=46165 RepID=A0A7D3ZZ54_ACTVE|nr:LysR family transcriptional regulator [Actinomadura verrucosospora]QKG23866.1 LysR family transcriptional regulator [Actinomadura verrucosospora]
MERREIEIFLTVAEELHFGRSAERLHVSVAMVSKTIKKLERSVGAALFDRTSRRVALTPIGRRLYDDVGPAHQRILDGFERAVAAGRGVDGVVRAGFLGTAVAQFVLRVAEVFQARHPACQVRIQESRYADGTGLLHDDVVDVLLIAAAGSGPDLAASPVLFREPPVLAVSARHPFARRDAVSVEDLARDKVLRPRGIPDELDALSVPASTPGGRPIERGMEFGTVQEMFALVGAGRGIFPVPRHASLYDSRPDVVYVPMPDGPPFEWRLVWRAAAETNRIRAFCEAAADLVAEDGSPFPAA